MRAIRLMYLQQLLTSNPKLAKTITGKALCALRNELAGSFKMFHTLCLAGTLEGLMF